MPTYDYVCDQCGHRFEEMQSFKDDPLKVCPKCREEKLRRLFGTGAAILFKGSGFYQTDYRSESYQAAAKADSGPKDASTDGKAGKDGKTDKGKGSSEKTSTGKGSTTSE